MTVLDALHAEMALRGAVAGLLLLHLANLLLPGPRPVVRRVLALWVASVLAYLACQRADVLLNLPRPLAHGVLALCVASTGWLWAAASALFDDDFRFGWPQALALAALTGLGLAANLPYFPDGDGPFRQFPAGHPVRALGVAHAVAVLGFSVAALWAVGRGWRADLVESRRTARRWVGLGIGLYALIALVVELALRDRPVGPLLPALHVLGIGLLAGGLALRVARHSLDEVLGVVPAPAAPEPPAADATHLPGAPAGPADLATPGAPVVSALPGTGSGLGAADDAAGTESGAAAAPGGWPAAAAAQPRDRDAAALARLDEAMRLQHAYRREGLSLADLAQTLGMGESPLRALINQRLGYRNFNDFLHHHRLREAAARLATEDLPILSIALGCGYGSIGPFNRAFKQRLGMTPTEYRAAARLGHPLPLP